MPSPSLLWTCYLGRKVEPSQVLQAVPSLAAFPWDRLKPVDCLNSPDHNPISSALLRTPSNHSYIQECTHPYISSIWQQTLWDEWRDLGIFAWKLYTSPERTFICKNLSVRPRMCPLEHYTPLALNFAPNSNITKAVSVGFYYPPRAKNFSQDFCNLYKHCASSSKKFDYIWVLGKIRGGVLKITFKENPYSVKLLFTAEL